MRRLIRCLTVFLLICALVSCDGRDISCPSADNSGTTEAADVGSGIKVSATPHFIRLSTAKDVYRENEEVVLIAHLGYDDKIECDDGAYKIVFKTPDGVFVTETNSYSLTDYPSKKYYMDQSGETVRDRLPCEIEFRIPVREFLEIGDGSIRAEIVRDTCRENEIESYQGSLFFSSTSGEAAFSINSIDTAASLLSSD